MRTVSPLIGVTVGRLKLSRKRALRRADMAQLLGGPGAAVARAAEDVSAAGAGSLATSGVGPLGVRRVGAESRDRGPMRRSAPL